MRWLLLACAVMMLTACSTKMGRDGHTETSSGLKYLAKSDVDRMADASRSDVVDSLLLIADKLYKRNPREWKKANVPSREAAVERLRLRVQRNWPELNGARERQAATLAFSDSYGGDRVGALMLGLLTMVDAAYEYKEEFFMLDSLNETKLFNTARNMEVALWKLNQDRAASGEPFLLANELDPNNRNLSFEREFGRIIGVLDLMARIVADRHGRALSRVSQSVAAIVFLPVGL